VRDKHGFTMSRLDILPEEIVDHIFRLAHSSKFEMSLSAITCHQRNLEYDTLVGQIFLNSNMTPKEREDWMLYKAWLDIVIDHPRDPHRLLAFSPEMQDKMTNSQYVIIYKYYKNYGYI